MSTELGDFGGLPHNRSIGPSGLLPPPQGSHYLSREHELRMAQEHVRTQLEAEERDRAVKSQLA